MKLRWFALLATLLLPAPSAIAQGNDAKTFVENIYRQYLGKNTPSIDFTSRVGLEQYFTTSLAALIDNDAREAEKQQEAPLLNGDPFVDAQDWEITDPVVTVQASADGKGATATAIFKNFGKAVTVRYLLVMTPRGWRIDNILWSEGDLRGLYQPPK